MILLIFFVAPKKVCFRLNTLSQCYDLDESELGKLIRAAYQSRQRQPITATN